MSSEQSPDTTELDPLGYLIVVDGTRCDGHGICVLRLPERISLDQWGYASLDVEPIVRRSTLRRALRAVLACPNGALELVETLSPSRQVSTEPGVGTGRLRL
ncbi:MAG: ferredoxin [Acidimicrobiaceae bacterium]|nr:ferredoxin [Acidimicrobiaceae bacterium]